jgi:hypothetical protein
MGPSKNRRTGDMRNRRTRMSCAINTEREFVRGTTIAVCPAPVIHTSEILSTGQKNLALVLDKRQERSDGQP